MNESCANCGQPVLPSDTVCWHCGYHLPPRSKPRQPAKSASQRDRSAGLSSSGDDGSNELDFRAITIYGSLTLAIILGLWLVMRSLSSHPILVRSAGIALGGEWLAVTDEGLRYTLSMPADWQWLDLGFRDQAELLERLQSRQPYIPRALLPLGEVAGDVGILSLAIGSQNLENTDPLPFVIVGQSERLQDLTPQAALDLIHARSLPISESAIDTRLAGQTQARFTVLDLSNAYQCRHIFVSGVEAPAYMVVACAPQSRFNTLENTLNDILDSFQLLDR